MRLSSSAVAAVITSSPERRSFPTPVTAGPKRIKLDICFVFTNYNPNEVYIMIYKGYRSDGESTGSTTKPTLIKIASFSERSLKLKSLAELLPMNENLEARLAQQQSGKVLGAAVFNYLIEDIGTNGNGIELNGKLKPEFVEALFAKDQARLDDIAKSKDIEL